jgi:iron(III) transport system ATP-binding protein
MISSASSPIIQLRNLCKHFGETRAVSEINLSVEPGALLALLGPSGCGKTTLLRLIAGLERPDSGTIELEGRPVANERLFLSPEARRVGMVFQDYALFPHLTVAENIAFPLKGRAANEIKARVGEMLERVGLAGLGGRFPHQLSGGQQQRVALARALASRPAVVLLDEPFSNLDAALRKIMREDVRRVLQATGTTTIFVTHDQEEALSLADQVAVMDAGFIRQIGTPPEIYLRPATRAIATFMGDVNFIHGEAHGRTVTCSLGKLLLASPTYGPVEVMIRPEAIKLTPELDGLGQLNRITFYGHDQMAEVTVPNSENLLVRTWAQPDLRPGLAVGLKVLGPVVAFTAPAPNL